MNKRRSNRQRKPNARYSFDPLTEALVGETSDEELRQGFELSNEVRSNRNNVANGTHPLNEDSDAPSDYSPGYQNVDISDQEEDEGDEEEDGEEEFEVEGRDKGENEVEGEANDVPELLRSTDLELEESDLRRPRELAHTDGRRRPPKDPHSHSRSRLLLEFHKGSYERRMDSFFGGDDDDWKPALRVRNRWYRFPTLPSHVLGKDGTGGMRLSYFSDTIRKLERAHSHAWSELLRKRQISNGLSEAEGKAFVAKPLHATLKILGGLKDERLCSLAAGKGMSLAEQSTSTRDGSSTEFLREGWLLNFGHRIQCLAWAPEQNDGVQYLCVSVASQDSNPSGTTAFAPTESYKDCLQIWAFDVTSRADAGKKPARTDKEAKKPRLVTVICTEWGYAKEFSWCPGLNLNDQDDGSRTATGGLGFLAVVSSDGKLRVLNVPCSPMVLQPQYLHISRAAFEATPEETIFTSLSWISSSVIAVGCSDGSVCVFSLEDHLRNNTMARPRPFFHHPIHETYILTISSGYPSCSHLIATSSMDGYFHVTDIRSPQIDTAHPPRARSGSSAISWLDHLQGWISPDDHALLKLYSVRRAFSHVAIGRADANIAVAATSPAHCGVLMGGLDGMILATSPIRKLFDTRTLVWLQPWFQHEWRSVKLPEGGSDDEVGLREGQETRGISPSKPSDSGFAQQQIVRLTEGYAAREVTMHVGDAVGQAEEVEGQAFNTIHEVATAVSSLAWNPNPNYGGWAAAGMGSGLLRVEDISI